MNKEALKDNWLISMEGLKGTVLKEAVKDLESLQEKDSQFKVNTITFCLDSDDKAMKYINKHINEDELFKKIGNPKIEVDLPKHTLDWNDELKYLKNINQEKVCMLDNSYDL